MRSLYWASSSARRACSCSGVCSAGISETLWSAVTLPLVVDTVARSVSTSCWAVASSDLSFSRCSRFASFDAGCAASEVDRSVDSSEDVVSSCCCKLFTWPSRSCTWPCSFSTSFCKAAALSVSSFALASAEVARASRAAFSSAEKPIPSSSCTPFCMTTSFAAPALRVASSLAAFVCSSSSLTVSSSVVSCWTLSWPS